MAAQKGLSPLWCTIAPSWTSTQLQCSPGQLQSVIVSLISHVAAASGVRICSQADGKLPDCLHGTPSAGRCNAMLTQMCLA